VRIRTVRWRGTKARQHEQQQTMEHCGANAVPAYGRNAGAVAELQLALMLAEARNVRSPKPPPRGWHARGDLLRGVLEGVAFNHRWHVDALADIDLDGDT
jgi:sugar (pentulose or hexulose) kinase